VKSYLVLLPIEIDGKIYHRGEHIALELETAVLYGHALRAVVAEGDAAEVKTEGQEESNASAHTNS
jgi:hypothetical protein